MDEKTMKEALRKGERVTQECKRAKAEDGREYDVVLDRNSRKYSLKVVSLR